MPGHHDAGNEYTSIEEAESGAKYAKSQGLGGKLIFFLSLKFPTLIQLRALHTYVQFG